MTSEQLQALKAWFDRYVKDFYSDDPKRQAGIRFKEEHTARVCENINLIGRSLHLNDDDLRLAETVALFHDLGRFRQFQVYGTFNDRRSENHALLGLKELERTRALSGLPEDEQRLAAKAIECHNMPGLPPDLDGRTLLFSRLIRDADKLDILAVTTEHYARQGRKANPVLASGLPDTPGYSPVLVENLLREQNCRYDDVKNLNDRKLLLLSWIYDMNFRYTIAEADKNGFVRKIIESLPGTEDIRRVHSHLQNYVARRLGSGA
ncbi:MAG: HD domain-containing protein [Firmicutes bacterium]|nr:HD domain-containing protein [Bacillota bacterium]